MQAAHPDHCDPYVVVRDGGISAIAYLVLFVTKFSLRSATVDLWDLGLFHLFDLSG